MDLQHGLPHRPRAEAKDEQRDKDGGARCEAKDKLEGGSPVAVDPQRNKVGVAAAVVARDGRADRVPCKERLPLAGRIHACPRGRHVGAGLRVPCHRLRKGAEARLIQDAQLGHRTRGARRVPLNKFCEVCLLLLLPSSSSISLFAGPTMTSDENKSADRKSKGEAKKRVWVSSEENLIELEEQMLEEEEVHRRIHQLQLEDLESRFHRFELISEVITLNFFLISVVAQKRHHQL